MFRFRSDYGRIFPVIDVPWGSSSFSSTRNFGCMGITSYRTYSHVLYFLPLYLTFPPLNAPPNTNVAHLQAILLYFPGCMSPPELPPRPPWGLFHVTKIMRRVNREPVLPSPFSGPSKAAPSLAKSRDLYCGEGGERAASGWAHASHSRF